MSEFIKTARILITLQCTRNCPGCANIRLLKGNNYKRITDLSTLHNYGDFVISGGEPMINPETTLSFINRIRNDYLKPDKKIYLYSSDMNMNIDEKSILNEIDGLTYCLHYESIDADIIKLKTLSEYLINYDRRDFISRLLIDTRIPEKYNLTNIDFSGWDIIKPLTWNKNGDCPLPDHEECLIYELF